MSLYRRGFARDAAACAAFRALLREVFDDDWMPAGDTEPVGIFDESGRCIAGLELLQLPLLVDGDRVEVTGIASVAVTPSMRGRGLFRRLMESALNGLEGPVLLYAEEPALYHRFGFAAQPQYRFEVSAPAPDGAVQAARELSLAKDRDLIQRLLVTRRPVSSRLAIIGGATTFMRKIAGEDDWHLAYLPDHDALIVYEWEDQGRLVLIDCVAAVLPSLRIIVSALQKRSSEIDVLFSPDLFDCLARPIPDDTGLMVRQAASIQPSSLRKHFVFHQPIRLPPSVEF